ncbi:hypothetical protein K8R61_01535 [bacterium]|nr:hypothetical protein [bacterium]
MKIKKRYISLLALILIMTAGVASVSAYQGDYTEEGPNCTPERHEVMEVAFENNDYNTWKEQMSGKGRVVNVVNQDNFAKFAEAHKLGQAGNKVEADGIRMELGLRTSNGEKMGKGYRGKNGERSGQKLSQGQGGRNGSMNQ